MKKYFLLAIYLLTMIAIYKHPIALPNEGKRFPLKTNDILVPPSEPMNFALGTMSSKSTFFDFSDEKRKMVTDPSITGKMK
jgi:hypothetical protein